MTKSFNARYKMVLANLVHAGLRVASRTGQMSELIGVQASWNAEGPFEFEGPLNWRFANELAHHLLTSEPIAEEVLSKRSKRFLDVPAEYADSICASYAPKIAKSMPIVLSQLAQDGTRRAYLPILEHNDAQVLTNSALAHLEYPCTVGWGFYPRYGNLHMVVHMRSQEALHIWPLDSFVQHSVLHHLCDKLCLNAGTITQQWGSIHVLTD